MASLVLTIMLSVAVGTAASAQEPGQPPDLAWTGSVDQKVWGLMTVWATAKYNFPFFDRRPELDWDAKAREYIPRVVAAPDREAYYRVLMEFAALLEDGHTGVNPPGWPIPPGTDKPPLELQVVEAKVVVARVGDTEENATQRIRPGLEVIEVDGRPVRAYFADHVLRYESRGTPQADDSIELWHLLDGPKGSTVELTVKAINGVTRTVRLTRDATQRSGPSFQWRIIEWYAAPTPVEGRMLDSGLFYIRISNFGSESVVKAFQQVLDAADWSAVRGVILDVRFNPGGDSDVAYAIVSHLVDRPVESGVWKSPKYVPAHRGWQLPAEWQEGHTGPVMIQPRAGRRYTGPLVILTGPATYSAAEDFLVPLHAAGRATLVGEKTAGSTGNPLRVALPGGGNFRVVTLDCRYPDGREFVGIGIRPDVEVHPTQADLESGRDPVLARAEAIAKGQGVGRSDDPKE